MAEPETVVPAHEKYGLPLSFSRDGSVLITGGFDGRVSRWSVPDWTEEASIAAHDRSVNCGAVTSEGLVVTGSTDNSIRVLDSDLSSRKLSLTGHTDTVAGLAAHPSESLVASASYDTTVRLWDLESSTEPISLSGHPNNVTSVEFVEDGSLVASGGIGDALVVWSLDSATEETRLEGHGQAVSGISTAGDETLWSVGYDGTVFLWSTDEWRVLRSFDLPGDAHPSGIAVDPVSEYVAVTRAGGVVIFDYEGRRVAEHSTDIKGIYMPRWTPDGSVLAVGGADGNIRIYDPDRTG